MCQNVAQKYVSLAAADKERFAAELASVSHLLPATGKLPRKARPSRRSRSAAKK